MKRLDRQVVDPRLIKMWLMGSGARRFEDLKPWNRRLRDPSRRISSAEVTKDFNLHAFNLEATLILDCSARSKNSGSLAAHMGMEQLTNLGKFGLRTRQDFGEPDRARTENKRMASLEDPDIRFPPQLLDSPELAGRVPIRMDGAIEYSKREVSDARSPRAYTHALHFLSGHCLLFHATSWQSIISRPWRYGNIIETCAIPGKRSRGAQRHRDSFKHQLTHRKPCSCSHFGPITPRGTR